MMQKGENGREGSKTREKKQPVEWWVMRTSGR